MKRTFLVKIYLVLVIALQWGVTFPEDESSANPASTVASARPEVLRKILEKNAVSIEDTIAANNRNIARLECKLQKLYDDNPALLRVVSKNVEEDCDIDAMPIGDQIRVLLTEEFDAGLLSDERNEASKMKAWTWKNRPSWRETFAWTRRALGRFVAARKNEMRVVAVGTAFVVLGATFLYAISDGGQINLSDLVPLLPQHLVLSISKNTGKLFFITLCHELGHALMNYAMNGHVPNIYLSKSEDELGDFIEILPGVQLGGLDPFAPACIQANITDMVTLSAEELYAIKEKVLLDLQASEGVGGRSLRELKQSSEYADRVASLVHDALAGNREKLTAFFAAGPAAGLAGSAAFKALSGESLMSLSAQDIEQLCELLPGNFAHTNTDGFYLISDGFGRPDVANRAKAIVEKMLPYAYIAAIAGYVGNVFYSCNVFNKFPGGVRDVVSMIGNTFRALGIAAINGGSLGLIYVEPV